MANFVISKTKNAAKVLNEKFFKPSLYPELRYIQFRYRQTLLYRQRFHQLPPVFMETNNSLMSASEPSSTIATTAPDILLGEAPAKMRRSNIDWEQTDISEYQGLYAVIIDDVLSPAECAELVEAAEATTNGVWEEALVNVGGGHQERRADTRNSARIIWDSPEIVARLWRRVVPLLPELEIINCSSPLLRLRKNRLPSKDIRMTRFHSSANLRSFLFHISQA